MHARFKVVVDYAYGSTSFVMPNVLAKLGADILGVNPYASTVGALGFDRAAHGEQVAGYVRTSGAHVGAVIDPDGEHLTDRRRPWPRAHRRGDAPRRSSPWCPGTSWATPWPCRSR